MVVNEGHPWKRLVQLVIPTKFRVSLTTLKSRLVQLSKLNPVLPICKGPHWVTDIIFVLLPPFTPLKLNP